MEKKFNLMENKKNFFTLLIKKNLLCFITFIVALLSLITISIIFNSGLLVLFYIIFFMIYYFTITVKLWLAPFFGILSICLYIAVSVLSKNWGEVIFNSIIVLPILIISAYTYFKNRNTKTTIRKNKISINEFFIFCSIYLIVCVGLYFILNLLETPYAIFATVTLFFLGIPNYLQFRRDSRMFYFYLFGNVFSILLWLMPMFYGEPKGVELIPVAANFLFGNIFNILGVINWNKKGEEQKILEEENGVISASGEF